MLSLLLEVADASRGHRADDLTFTFEHGDDQQNKVDENLPQLAVMVLLIGPQLHEITKNSPNHGLGSPLVHVLGFLLTQLTEHIDVSAEDKLALTELVDIFGRAHLPNSYRS